MKLSVIIVNYNVKFFVEQCVLSVLRASTEIDTEIFIVDNNSTDGSVEYLNNSFPHNLYRNIKIIANTDNVGFGRANNQALKQAKGEYILFLNPDTIITEDTLSDCLKFAEEHSEFGGLGVRMYQANGKFALESRRGLPTPFTSFCKMSGLSSLLPKSRLFGRYYMQYLDVEDVNEIDVISGAFLFVNRRAIELTGGFDESFFMYGEDIDLSYRLKKAGFINYYLPTPIIHYKGESTEKTSYRYVRVFYEAMLIFFNKHYRQHSLFFSFFVWLAIYLRAFISFFWQQIDKLREFLNGGNRDAEIIYIYVGNEEMLDDAAKISKALSLEAQYVPISDFEVFSSSLTSENPSGVYRYIIFDSDNIPYKDMLRLISANEGKRLSLGTYSLHKKALVTNYITYKL